jgi:hypothetical protein
MNNVRESLADLLRQAGQSQYSLVKAGFSSSTARRLLNLDTANVTLDNVMAAADLIGYTVQFVKSGKPVLAPKESPTGAAKPGKKAGATFLPGELEPVTRKRSRKLPAK